MSQNLKGFATPTQLGDYAESVVTSEFMRHGYNVLRAFGSGLKYDLVVEKDGRFLRVQVKSGNLSKGCIQCRLFTGSGTERSPKVTYSEKQVDLFAIYCYELGQVYLIPVGEKIAYLRTEPTKNNQSAGVHLAVDYEFSVMEKKLWPAL